MRAKNQQTRKRKTMKPMLELLEAIKVNEIKISKHSLRKWRARSDRMEDPRANRFLKDLYTKLKTAYRR